MSGEINPRFLHEPAACPDCRGNEEECPGCEKCSGTGYVCPAHELAGESPVPLPRMPQEPTEEAPAGEDTPETAQTIPCPDCDGKGGWMRPEYSGPDCVGQYFEDCARCETTGQIPKPKPIPAPRDNFHCPDHPDQMTTLHIATPEGSYRRACFLCPPIEPIVLVKECNQARKKREKERKRGKRKQIQQGNL